MKDAEVKIDFKNQKDGKLFFYEKIKDKSVIEYAYMEKDNDHITFKTEENDVRTFPKDNLNDFLMSLYNRITDSKIGKTAQKTRADAKNKTSTVYFSLRMAASNTPLINLFFIHMGILGALKYFNIRYTISKVKQKDSFLSVKIKNKSGDNGFLNIYCKNLSEEYMVNGIKKEASKLFPVKEEDLNSTELMQKYFRDYYSISRYINLKNAKTNFIDVTTKKVLRGHNDPTDFFEIFGKFIPDKLLNGKIEDITDLSNRRIRMSESITHLAYKNIQQGIAKMKSNSGQYNIKLFIDKNFITKQLAASGMLQYTENINPLSELVLTSKITKVGVGNPKKEQIDMIRRDLNPSYFGTISPTTTNEYGNIGLNQTLTNKALIKDRFGSILIKNFGNDNNGIDMLSSTDALSPFFEYDDTTRRVMGNQQFAQFAQIEHPDEPLLQTGMESVIPYLVSDKFAIKAKEDGKVTVLDHENLTLKYKSGSDDNFSMRDKSARTSRGVYIPLKLTPLVKQGENVKKGQILATTNSLKTGKLAVGKNLVVALMSYRGMNYEDGWVAIDSIGEKYQSKVYQKIIIPIKNTSTIAKYNITEGNITQPGDTLIEFSDPNSEDSFSDLSQEDNMNISAGRELVNGNIKYRSPGGIIKEVTILINDTSIDKKLLSEWKAINKDITSRIKKCSLILDPVKKMDCQDEISNIKCTVVGGHKLNNAEFEGSIIEIFIEKDNPIQNGSKFSLLGSSGGKGTIQYLYPEDKAPYSTETNLKIEFVPTPLSLISRKNISILMSMYLGKVIYFLNDKTKKMILGGQIEQAKKLLLEMFSVMDKTPKAEILEDLKEFFKRNPKEIINFVKQSDPLTKPAFPMVITPFKNKIKMDDIKKAADILKIPLNEKVCVPEEDGIITEYEVPVGIIPVAYLEHFPQYMANVRGSIKAKKQAMTGQGRSGTRDGDGAVSMGLYDTFALASQKSTNLITELHMLKSDNQAASSKLRRAIITTGKVPSLEDLDLTEEIEKTAKTKLLVDNYFKGAMLEPSL